MNMINLENRRAVVTGGARGIGVAIIRRLVASGNRGSLWDADKEAVNEAADRPENALTR